MGSVSQRGYHLCKMQSEWLPCLGLGFGQQLTSVAQAKEQGQQAPVLLWALLNCAKNG